MVVIERDANGTPTVWCDPEIADLVGALICAGIRTVASCSGHGEKPGIISLADGRELLIAPDYETAQVTKCNTGGGDDGRGAVGYVDGSRLHELREGRLNLALWAERSAYADTPLYARPPSEAAAVDDGSVDYARTQAYKWLDERDARLAALYTCPPSKAAAVDDAEIERVCALAANEQWPSAYDVDEQAQLRRIVGIAIASQQARAQG